MTKTVYAIKDRRGEVRAYHVRTDTPDGKDVSWLGPDRRSGLNGTPSSELPLYNAHRLDDWPDPIIVTEGEKAAYALVKAGFHAVGTVTGAASTPSEGVLADLEGRAIILWPDADDVGREHMRRVGASLFERAAVGWLEPPGDVVKGWDAADAVAESWDIADTLKDATAFEPAPPRVRVLTGVQFLADAAGHEDRDEIVEDLLLDEGLYFIVGEPGSLKTMLTLQLAACVGHGLPFLNLHTARTNVVYFGFEGATRRLADRIRAQMGGLGTTEPGFSIAFKEPVSLDDREGLDDWCAAVEPYAPCLTIIDPFAEAHTSDEVKDASRLLGGLRRLQRAGDGPVVVVHHPTKSTEGAKVNRLRGHGSYIGAADAVLWQDRPDRLGTAADLMPLKVRDLESSFSTPLEFDPETCLLVPSSTRLSARILAVRLVHERGQPRRADIVRDVAARTSRTERAVERAIARAIKDGELMAEGEVLTVPTEWQR